MAKKTAVNSRMVLHLVVSVFLILTGILGLVAYSSKSAEIARALSSLFGGKSTTLSLIVSIVELTAGVVLLAAFFVKMKARTPYLACIVIFILWAVRIVYVLFVKGAVEQTAIIWLQSLSVDLVVLTVLWIVAQGVKKG